MLAATRDAMYGWTSERLVSNQAALGQGAYLYYFDHGYPATAEWKLHAFHAAELPYIFGTAGKTPPLWPKIPDDLTERSEEHTSELQSLMRISYAVFCLKKKKTTNTVLLVS